MEIDVFDSRLCPEKKLMSVDTESFPVINIGNFVLNFTYECCADKHLIFQTHDMVAMRALMPER